MGAASEMQDTLSPVQIPIQMMVIADRDGRLTPVWFRFEAEDHSVEKVIVEKTISRDESNSVGIREKRFICSAVFGDRRRLLEIRCRVESQQWRIFRFLS